MTHLVKAEGMYKNANYVIETRVYSVGMGFDKPVEGTVPLPWIGFKRVDVVAGIMAPGETDALLYRTRRNMEVGIDENTGSGVMTGDETIIAIDDKQYLDPHGGD